MLDALKKKLAGAESPVVALAAHEALQAEFAGYKATAEELLAAAEAANKELTEKLAALQEFAAAAEAQAAEAEAKAAQAKANARKEKLVEKFGTEAADKMFAAVESLDDANFEVVVSAMSLSFKTEAESKMFKEQGAEIETDAEEQSRQSGKSPLMKMLEAEFSAE